MPGWPLLSRRAAFLQLRKKFVQVFAGVTFCYFFTRIAISISGVNYWISVLSQAASRLTSMQVAELKQALRFRRTAERSWSIIVIGLDAMQGDISK